MTELIICPYCKSEKDLHYIGDEVVAETPCKCLIKPKFDNEYMVKIVKEIAKKLTRKAHVKNSRLV